MLGVAGVEGSYDEEKAWVSVLGVPNQSLEAMSGLTLLSSVATLSGHGCQCHFPGTKAEVGFQSWADTQVGLLVCLFLMVGHLGGEWSMQRYSR